MSSNKQTSNKIDKNEIKNVENIKEKLNKIMKSKNKKDLKGVIDDVNDEEYDEEYINNSNENSISDEFDDKDITSNQVYLNKKRIKNDNNSIDNEIPYSDSSSDSLDSLSENDNYSSYSSSKESLDLNSNSNLNKKEEIKIESKTGSFSEEGEIKVNLTKNYIPILNSNKENLNSDSNLILNEDNKIIGLEKDNDKYKNKSIYNDKIGFLDETEDILLTDNELAILKQNTSITTKLKNTKLRKIIKTVVNSKYKRSLLEKILQEDKHFKFFCDEILGTLGFSTKINENFNIIDI